MAGEKSKKSKEQETAKRPIRGAAISLAAALLALSAVGMNRGAGWLRTKLSDRLELQLSGMDLSLSPAGDWLSSDLGEAIAQEAGWRAQTFDLAQPGLVEQLATRLAKSPWVESVQVAKSYRKLHATVKYRKPCLFVPVGERGFYAAADGTVLPAEGAKRSALDACIAVEGLNLGSIPLLGERVQDNRWSETVRIAESLRECPATIGVAAILLESDSSGRVQYLLRTAKRRRILWGPPLPTDAATVLCRLQMIAEKLKEPASLGDDFEPKPIDATR